MKERTFLSAFSSRNEGIVGGMNAVEKEGIAREAEEKFFCCSEEFPCQMLISMGLSVSPQLRGGPNVRIRRSLT